MRKSTRFDNWFCQQDFGHCGELVLPAITRKRGGREVNAIFHRTSWENDLRTRRSFNPQYQVVLHLYFIAGREVSRGEYLPAPLPESVNV